MKPVDQQFLHDKDAGTVGDCFRACIASILELPIEGVPHFALLGSRWLRAADAFLGAFGKELSWHNDSNPPRGVWVIQTVKSPRSSDLLHSVIYRNGQPQHDPHPSRAFGEVTSDYFIVTPDTPSPQANLKN